MLSIPTISLQLINTVQRWFIPLEYFYNHKQSISNILIISDEKLIDYQSNTTNSEIFTYKLISNNSDNEISFYNYSYTITNDSNHHQRHHNNSNNNVDHNDNKISLLFYQQLLTWIQQ